MPVKILINNRQRKLRIRTGQLKRLIAFFMRRAMRLDPDLDGEVSFMLLGDRGMQRLNRRFLNSDTPTDVISFRYAVPRGLTGGVIGECFVNAERASALGPRYGGLANELALYLAHACDHLTGAVDETDAQRQSMRRREQRWLRAAREQQLLTEDLALP